MQPKTYRIVAHDVQAMQWNEENRKSLLDWLAAEGCGYTYHEINSGGELIIYTNGGPVQVNVDWWVVRDSMREFYMIKPDIFNLLHKEVNTDDKDNVV